nr:Tn3 family transposase [Enterococcus sp. 665A]
MKDLDISLLAVLLSESCNIGFSPVSKEGFDSLKYDRLVYVNHHYIRVDTLSAANQKIIHAHGNLLPLRYGVMVIWLQLMVFVMSPRSVPYILEVIQNILAVVVG